MHTVVVAFHGAEALDRCLGALGHAHVTVVDNSSSAAVAEVAERHGASYSDPGRNLGFAAGVNVALREILSGPPVDVLLLNPDAALEPPSRDRLMAFMRNAELQRVGAVAPRLVGTDGFPQQTLWPYPSPLRAWADAAGLSRVPSRDQFAIGAVLLLRWEALQEVGLFDERFFLYAEEADWQRRALNCGWHTRICNEAVSVHVGAGTSDDPVKRERLFHAAHEIYIRKWYGMAGWLFYRAAAIMGAGVRAVLLRAERRQEAVRRLSIYARGPCRVAAS